MPRYFMHLIDSVDTLLDPDGIEVSFDAISARALANARDCMAGEVQGGRLDLRYRIDVHDESGKVVHSVAFADALEVIGPS